MSLTYGCIVPHSPNLVPEVSERATAAARTREAMGELGMNLGVRRPRTCVVVSPHGPFLPDAFGVWRGERLHGSMERFQAPQVEIELTVDNELAEAILDISSRMELPVGPMDGNWKLDRGVTVPALYLLDENTKVVPVSTSMLGWDEHWLFGTAIANAARMVEGEVAIIASSNLSHRVGPDSPHGYHPKGQEFDRRVLDLVERGRLSELLDMPHDVVREASECGLIPMMVLGGAFDGHSVSGKVLSYEYPFGIGYMVAEIMIAEDDDASPLVAEAAVAAGSETRLVVTNGEGARLESR